MRQVLAFFLILGFVFGFWAQNQNAFAQEQLVKIRILPERNVVEAGDEIWIGIEKSIAEHWHTYWKNPGDSGVELRVNWEMPEGFEVDDLHWPVPKKIPYPPLLNYGYEGRTILLQKLSVPDALPDGAIELKANIELLVCKEECIPEYGTYSLSLNNPVQMVDDNAAYLEAAREKLPREFAGNAQFDEVDGHFTLKLSGGVAANADIQNAEFLPLDWGVVENPAEVSVTRDGDVLIFKQKRGAQGFEDLVDGQAHGVLAYELDGKRQGVRYIADKADLASVNNAGVESAALKESRDLGIIGALFFALIGGLILNLMPCVFPVLSLKALSLVKTAEKHPEQARMHGISYTAGVILSFVAIAGALIALKAGGAQIGWGFQLQNPLVVGALAYLLFILGLNLSGLFEFANPFANAGSKLAGGQGYGGSFFTGVLATLVATPCTAPFMAGAIGFALLQGPVLGLLIFAALGLGLALPYLVLSFIPALQRFMPKPGAWMDVFKQLLAFPMFGAAVWLVWVLGTQTGVMGMGSILAGMTLLSFAIWLWKHRPKDKFWRGFVATFAVLSVLFALMAIPKYSMSGYDTVSKSEMAFGEVFSDERLEELLEGDAPIFVEMTASWCITCKVNNAIAIDIAPTRTLFDRENVRYLIGDWTNEDPVITRYLNRYGRNGVPLYVYYGARDENGQRPEARVLPQVLTHGIIRDVVKGR